MFKVPGKNRQTSLLVEILMIVIGINVALWFEDWFQDLRDAETEEQYLVDLRDDLLVDTSNLDSSIEWNEVKVSSLGNIVGRLDKLLEAPPEEQSKVIFAPSSYSFFQPSDFTYHSLQESGDFRLISNMDIKKGILRLDRRHKEIALMQSNFLQALDDGYIPLMMKSYDFVTGQVTDPTIVQDQSFKNFFVYTIQDTEMMISHYERVRSQSAELIDEIDRELSDRR
jgi:predicted RND superfamily exporter protein